MLLMKKVVFLYFLPFALSITTIYYAVTYNPFNSFFGSNKHQKAVSNSSFDFIPNFNDNTEYENQFLLSDTTHENIFLIGSSELGTNSTAIPYRFISTHFSTKVKAVGHAGNQCLSIYCQLLANHNRLNNAPITFIISPGWFESQPAKGTSSEIFLEFNSERFLKNINNDEGDLEFRVYANKRVNDLYNEFNSPNLQLKLMNFEYLRSKSVMHKVFYSPLIFCDNLLLTLKGKVENVAQSNLAPVKRHSIVPDSILINWDSLYTYSKNVAKGKATNNNMGINNEYYNQYIHGGVGKMDPVNPSYNQELIDFKMLVKLIKAKNINASFVISPLNPLYFKNLKDISPTMDIVVNEIKINGFSYLNLLEIDTNKYEKPILTDIMHMDDYGWYKVDKFMVDTYHLNISQ